MKPAKDNQAGIGATQPARASSAKEWKDFNDAASRHKALYVP
jgi:hypothetical protein